TDMSCPASFGNLSNQIKLFVRVRPLIHETSLTTDGYQGLCHLSEHPLPAHQAVARTFTYDHVADVDVTQVCFGGQTVTVAVTWSNSHISG
uniref:Kinesin motor domain-containing protein n=1 Tax=Oncorhynchus mykiss TaxID=8022 RepID=A0A8C7SU85_ONCMY